MENTSQTLDLEGLHREMHGIAEQIRIMNENNVRLIQHIATNNPPPAAAPIQEEVYRFRHSRRSGDRKSQSRQSTGQTRSRQRQLQYGWRGNQKKREITWLGRPSA